MSPWSSRASFMHGVGWVWGEWVGGWVGMAEWGGWRAPFTTTHLWVAGHGGREKQVQAARGNAHVLFCGVWGLCCELPGGGGREPPGGKEPLEGGGGMT